MPQSSILIVGINSFLAQALLEYIPEHYTVTGIYHRHKHRLSKPVELIQVDELELLKNRSFETVFLISSFIPPKSEPLDDQRLIGVNLLLPKRICQLFPHSRLIFCSSVSVYENSTFTKAIDKHCLPAPQSRYALSKLWGEQIIATHNSFGIIRFSSLYGPGMNLSTFMPYSVLSALQNKGITLFGQGTRSQNYLYVADAAQLLWELAQVPENHILLGVNPNNYTNTEIAEAILNVTPGKIMYIGADNSKSFRYSAKSTQEILPKVVYTPLSDGLKSLVTWIKKQS